MKKISRLLKVYQQDKDGNFDYEGGQIDEARENYGEEFEHKEWCNFTYLFIASKNTNKLFSGDVLLVISIKFFNIYSEKESLFFASDPKFISHI